MAVYGTTSLAFQEGAPHILRFLVKLLVHLWCLVFLGCLTSCKLSLRREQCRWKCASRDIYNLLERCAARCPEEPAEIDVAHGGLHEEGGESELSLHFTDDDSHSDIIDFPYPGTP